MIDGEIIRQADDLVDQEGGRAGGEAARRGCFEQAASDFGAPFLERDLEQVDERAATLAGIAGLGGDGLEPLGEHAAVDDRAAAVEMREDVAHASPPVALSR